MEKKTRTKRKGNTEVDLTHSTKTNKKETSRRGDQTFNI